MLTQIKGEVAGSGLAVGVGAGYGVGEVETGVLLGWAGGEVGVEV